MDKETIESRIRILLEEKSKIIKEIIQLKKNLLEIQYGIKDGQPCLYNGKKAIVRLVDNAYWFSIALMKKNGDYSSTVRYVYGGDKVEKIV